MDSAILPQVASAVEENRETLEPPAKRPKYAEEEDVKANVFTAGCTVCQSSSSKYRCPGCNVVTCSLACTKQHRTDTGCKGTRDRTAFVPISRFNETHLVSDINLLSDTSRTTEVGRKTVGEDEEEKLSKRFKILHGKAKQLNLKLHFLPSMMSKHRTNSTRFDQRTQTLHWHAEVHFDLLDKDGKVDLKGLDDALPAVDAIQRALSDAANSAIQAKVKNAYPEDLSAWRVFMLQGMCPANKPLYHPFPAGAPMRETLLKTDILEYPTLYVTAASNEAKYEHFSDDLFAQRSQAHMDYIYALAPADSSDNSSDGSDDDSSDDDSSSDDSSSESGAPSVQAVEAPEASEPKPEQAES